MNFKYSPGQVGYGAKGSDGSLGTQGLALYFTDFNPITNFIAIETAIANDEVLWSTSPPGTKLPGGRIYLNGDLFIDNRGYVYEINADTDDFEKRDAILSKTGFFFTSGQTTDDGFERWSNIYDGSVKYIIDNNKSSLNYLNPPEIYGIDLENFNRIEFTDNDNGAFSLYSIGEIPEAHDHQSLSIIKDSTGFRIGNLNSGNIIRNTNLTFDVSLLLIHRETSLYSLDTPSGVPLTKREINVPGLFDYNFNLSPGDFQSYAAGSDDITIQWTLPSFTSEPNTKGDLYFYEASTNFAKAYNFNDVSLAKPIVIHDLPPSGSVTINGLGLGTKWQYYMLLSKDGWQKASNKVTAITGSSPYIIKVIKPVSKTLTADYLGVISGGQDVDLSTFVFNTWNASSNVSWMSFYNPASPGVPIIPSGSTGEYTFDVSLERNSGGSSRIGNIALRALSTPNENIIVTQSAYTTSAYFDTNGYLQFLPARTNQTMNIKMDLYIKGSAEGTAANHRRSIKYIQLLKNGTPIYEINTGIVDGGASLDVKESSTGASGYTFSINQTDTVQIKFFNQYRDGGDSWSAKAEGLDCIYGTNIWGSWRRRGGGWAKLNTITKTGGDGTINIDTSKRLYYNKKDTTTCALFKNVQSNPPTINN